MATESLEDIAFETGDLGIPEEMEEFIPIKTLASAVHDTQALYSHTSKMSAYEKEYYFEEEGEDKTDELSESLLKDSSYVENEQSGTPPPAQ